MERAVLKQPIHPVEDYERDLAELRFQQAVNDKHAPRRMEGAAAALVFLSAILVVMASGAIFGLWLMGWL